MTDHPMCRCGNMSDRHGACVNCGGVVDAESARFGIAQSPPPGPSTRNVRKFLDLSTSHLPQNEMEEITAAETTVYPDFYGAWVYTGLGLHGELDLDADGVPFPVLDQVLEYARGLDCVYVRFDADGPHEPGLATFDW